MKHRVLMASLLLGAWGWSARQSTPAAMFTLPGGGPVVIVDLNRDGQPDIVTRRGDDIAVYLGDGRGSFDQAAGSPFAAGSNPSDLATGDFNEDGHLDIAVANHETTYSTLLAGDGTGRLAPSQQIPVPSRPHPHGVAPGDFNGDGHLDLAIESWEENTVLVFHGNGKAAFDREPRRLAVGRRPYHKLRAGDFNNDGKSDLVTTNGDGSSVSVMCSNASGVLQPAKEIAITRSPFAVAIGDVNGDRNLDLAVAHRWGGVDPRLDGLTLLLGGGDCGFRPTPESPLKPGASPTDVAIGDYNGDGIGDIATANMGSNDATLYLGSRSGLRPASGSPRPVGRGPIAIALADLNSDGKADIVAAGAEITIVMSRD